MFTSTEAALAAVITVAVLLYLSFAFLDTTAHGLERQLEQIPDARGAIAAP